MCPWPSCICAVVMKLILIFSSDSRFERKQASVWASLSGSFTRFLKALLSGHTGDPYPVWVEEPATLQLPTKFTHQVSLSCLRFCLSVNHTGVSCEVWWMRALVTAQADTPTLPPLTHKPAAFKCGCECVHMQWYTWTCVCLPERAS